MFEATRGRSATPDYARGQVVVKLKAKLDPFLQGAGQGTVHRDNGEQLSSALDSIADLSGGVRPNAFEALAQHTGESGRDHGLGRIISDRGLDRVFVLKFDKEVDIAPIIAELERSGSVEYAEPNYLVKPGTVIPDDPNFNVQWGLNNVGSDVGGFPSTPSADIKAPAAWEVTTGSPGVLVAVTDTGIDRAHPDLAANIYTNPGEIEANGKDDDRNGFIDDVHGFDVNAQSGDTSDIYGHGTQMAGIIGAEMNNRAGISGISQSKILPVKFYKPAEDLPGGVEATVVDAARALLYSIAAGAKIINASWSTLLLVDRVSPEEAKLLEDAVAATNDAGVLLVCIAGNDGFNNDFSKVYPGAFQKQNEIVVAATDYNDNIWRRLDDPFGPPLTGFGPNSVHLGAPGVEVWTTLARGDCELCSASENPADWYGAVSGTSASAAFVSGVAALVRSKYPDESAAIVRRRIVESTDIRPQLTQFVISGGRLNASSALAIEINITPPVLETAKYKKGSGKLFVTGQAIQSGAVLVVGNSSFPLKPKGEKLFARVPQSAFTPGLPVEIRLRNPDGGLSLAKTITL